MKAEEHHTGTRKISGVEVSIVSYRIGDKYYCHVSNLDPGATIARAEAGSAAEAETAALNKATARLAGSNKP